MAKSFKSCHGKRALDRRGGLNLNGYGGEIWTSKLELDSYSTSR